MSVELAEELGGANQLIALDTAREPGKLKNYAGYYDLNGNNGLVENTSSHDNLNYNTYLSENFNFSRSFVGATSGAGNQKLSATAKESYLIDFGIGSTSTDAA